jgi:hypothetical protein
MGIVRHKQIHGRNHYTEMAIEERSRFKAFNDACDSNQIDVSDLHHEKQDEPRISTLRGMIIEWSDDDENAEDSICVHREFYSNEIDASHLNPEKHHRQTISISPGIWRCDDFEKLRINL